MSTAVTLTMKRRDVDRFERAFERHRVVIAGLIGAELIQQIDIFRATRVT